MKLFADTGCDLPKQFLEENDVIFFPLRVQLQNEDYLDLLEIDPKAVYDAMRQKELPKTSQVSPEQFLTAFEKLAKNEEEGLYIAISSHLSGTHQTAVMIAAQVREQYPNFKLTIIDSKCISLGCGLLIKEAIKLRNQGQSLQQVTDKITRLASHMQHIFTVEDLHYLAAGGRISKSSAFIGGLLSIKPILHVDDGKLVPLEKVRGRKKSIARMIEMMAERGGDFTTKSVGISHADDLPFAEEVKSSIEKKLQPASIELTMVGSAIGAHAGPGTIAIFFTDNEEESVH